jgi:alkanesulfonate monooxygenase SsuD/methylene tetrahydromethanopterin reductase-like flavin-dependent oxidoreductase (luciferase family)
MIVVFGATVGSPWEGASMANLRTGVVISAGSAREFAELAVAAEKAGWDAIFTYEAIWGQDAWITMTAATMQTSTIRIGALLTPLARVKPWEFAGRAATLDVLSGGRLQLAVGLGALHPGWVAFERDEGRKVRAEKVDEGLTIYDGLMHGQPYEFSGKHYQVHPTDFLTPPTSIQRPRVPVWVVGAYPAEKSLRRAAQWDGILPTKVGYGVDATFTPDDLAEVVSALRPLREELSLPWAGYDVVAEGLSEPGAAGDSTAKDWVAAGATWWVESDWSMGEDAVTRHRARIEAGPPRA